MIMDHSSMWLLVALVLVFVLVVCCDPGVYYVGVGRADVTGPAAEVEMVTLLLE